MAKGQVTRGRVITYTVTVDGQPQERTAMIVAASSTAILLDDKTYIPARHWQRMIVAYGELRELPPAMGL